MGGFFPFIFRAPDTYKLVTKVTVLHAGNREVGVELYAPLLKRNKILMHRRTREGFLRANINIGSCKSIGYTIFIGTRRLKIFFPRYICMRG